MAELALPPKTGRARVSGTRLIGPRDRGTVQSDSTVVGVFFLDLDNFKNINDSMGRGPPALPELQTGTVR